MLRVVTLASAFTATFAIVGTPRSQSPTRPLVLDTRPVPVYVDRASCGLICGRLTDPDGHELQGTVKIDGSVDGETFVTRTSNVADAAETRFRVAFPGAPLRSLIAIRVVVVDEIRHRRWSTIVTELPEPTGDGTLKLGDLTLRLDPIWASGFVVGADGEPAALDSVPQPFGVLRDLTLFEPEVGRFELRGRPVGLEQVRFERSIQYGLADDVTIIRRDSHANRVPSGPRTGSIDAHLEVDANAIESLRVQLRATSDSSVHGGVPAMEEFASDTTPKGSKKLARFQFRGIDAPASYRLEVVTLTDSKPLIEIENIDIGIGRCSDPRLAAISLPEGLSRTTVHVYERNHGSHGGGLSLWTPGSDSWHEFRLRATTGPLSLVRRAKKPIHLVELLFNRQSSGIGSLPRKLDLEFVHRPDTFSGAWVTGPGLMPTWIEETSTNHTEAVELSALPRANCSLRSARKMSSDEQETRYRVHLRPMPDVLRRLGHGLERAGLERLHDPRRENSRSLSRWHHSSITHLGHGSYEVIVERECSTEREQEFVRVPEVLPSVFVIFEDEKYPELRVRFFD